MKEMAISEKGCKTFILQEKSFLFHLLLFQNVDITEVHDLIQRSEQFTKHLVNVKVNRYNNRPQDGEQRCVVARGKKFPLFYSIQSGPGAHIVFHSMSNMETIADS
jgi:hypothetical protein